MPKEEPAEAKTADESSEATQLQALARRFTPALRRFFGKRASQPADVDDLIQEVFTRLAKRSISSEIQQPEAYLLRAAGNVWRDSLRRRQTHADAEHDEYHDEHHAYENYSPERVLQVRQSIEHIMTALNALPDRTRQVFVLCRVEGMRHRTVARRLGVSVSSVDKHMMKAIAHLAESLDDEQ